MKKITFLIPLLVTLFFLNVHFVFAEEPWSKYPDNSGIKFEDVDSFYNSIDKKQYVEFENAKLNIREKTYWKDVNKAFSKADKYGKARSGGDGFHPKRQVYVFITISPDGKNMKTAVFDAEKQRLISASN